MKVATVNMTTKLVENVIVAAVGYEPPEGLFCVEVPEDSSVSIGWEWVEGATFVDPNSSSSPETGAF